MEILKNPLEQEPADVEMFLVCHAGLIRRVANRYARSVEEAEDIAQDARLKILCAADELDSVRNTSAWVRTVARNAAMDHLAKTRLHKPIEEASGIAASHPDADPERAALARCALRETLRSVRGRQRAEREIVAGIAAGQNETEIAEQLGKTKNAVYSCLFRLRRTLAAERELGS